MGSVSQPLNQAQAQAAPFPPFSALAVCMVLSGFSALIYQMAWLREFRLIFGTSTSATAAVAAIFMTGLGAGSVILGRRLRGHFHPARVYAKLELFIAFSAALTPFLLTWVRGAYVEMGGTFKLGLAWGTVLRLLLTAAVLLIPTFLLGGTLPAAAQAAHGADDCRRRNISFLYALNTAGAVTGVLFSTFWGFEHLGTTLTLWLACGINLVVALAAWQLPAGLVAAVDGARSEPRAPGARAPAYYLLTAAAVLGAVFFLMELVWYRLLSPLLGGTTFMYGIILGFALFGIGLGSLLYSLGGKQGAPTLRGLVVVCGFQALALALAYGLGDRLAVLAMALQPAAQLGLVGKTMIWGVISAIVVCPSALLAGIQFPMLLALLGGNSAEAGSRTGLLYGWNTAGAAGGSIAGGFLLMPVLTAPGLWRASIGVVAALALWGLILLARQVPRRRLLLPAMTCVVALLVLGAEGPTAAWRHSPIGAGRVEVKATSWNDWKEFLHRRRASTLWEAEGRESSVALNKHGGLALLVNGKSDGNARGDAPTQVMCGLIGALSHARPETALLIGLGTGSSAGWLGAVPTIARVDTVELEPAIIRAAEHCAAVNLQALSNPKVNIRVGDGRELLLTSSETYDLIVSQPSNPYRAGVASLFTREFYRAAERQLSSGGLFVQWVQAYEVDSSAIATIYATLAAVFPEIETWWTEVGDLVLVASRSPIEHDIEGWRERIREEPYRSALANVWRVHDVEGAFVHYVANSDLLRLVLAEEPLINTDDQNRLEFLFAASVGRQGEVTVEQLHAVAHREGFRQPRTRNGRLDPERLSDRRLSAQILHGLEAIPEVRTEEFKIRSAAKVAYADKKHAEALALWRSQAREPEDLIELLLVAHCMAVEGDPQASLYIEQLRAWQPNEAEALLARHLIAQKRPVEALDGFERAIRGWQQDPWSAQPLMIACLNDATQLVIQSENRGAARRLYEALGTPFAVYLLEKERLNALVLIATHLDGDHYSEHTRGLIAGFEPHVPWTRKFLALRADCYRQLRDPRASAAARDLAAFDRHSPKEFLQAREKSSSFYQMVTMQAGELAPSVQE